MRSFRYFVFVAAVFAGLQFSAGAGAADQRSPGELAESFHDGLVGVMKEAKALGIQGRYDALLPLINGTFNITLMAATVTAPYWRNGQADQKAALVEAFRGMSVATLATLFDGYSNEKFTVVRSRKSGKRIVVVDAEIRKSDGGIVKISYVVANTGGRWWIIDIVIDVGISEIKKRRNEFVRILKEGGLAGLTGELTERTKELLAGKRK